MKDVWVKLGCWQVFSIQLSPTDKRTDGLTLCLKKRTYPASGRRGRRDVERRGRELLGCCLNPRPSTTDSRRSRGTKKRKERPSCPGRRLSPMTEKKEEIKG